MVVEILPDCITTDISLAIGQESDLSFIGYFGKTVDEQLDVTERYTHLFDGHYIDEAGVYDDYCGTLAIDLVGAPSTLTIQDNLIFNSSPAESEIITLDDAGLTLTFDLYLLEYKEDTIQ